MSRCVIALGVMLSVCAFAPAQKAKPTKPPGPLDEARVRLHGGNYAEARELYASLAKADAKLAPACAIGTATSYRLEGEYATARKVLDDAVAATPKEPSLLAHRADLLYFLGEWKLAQQDTTAALAVDADHVLAKWTLGRLQRDRGAVEEARETFRWAVRYYNKADVADPADLVAISECASEFARWQKNSKQFAFILNEVIKDATKKDPTYWPAEQFAGMLLLEKYNRPDALEAFDAALKINPKAADALVGKALAAMAKYDLKEADTLADQALKANPNHPPALRVKAEIELSAGDYPAAQATLQRAREISPRDHVTCGKLGAVHLLQQHRTEFEALTATVLQFDPKPGSYYHEVAGVLEERKQYAKAEEYYKKAAEARPLLSGPRTGLGMLYLRLGMEKEGRALLEESFKADPFNVRVSNSRKVLAHLDGYTTVETAHYTLKFDAKTDAILGAWLADSLEEIHAELKAQFNYEPPGKFVVEVFNTHEMFSGRTVGVPDLHTIGACTGRVVAMASPSAKGVNKPFNWGRVMRHELTHIFNLAQTNYQCPHWITEGLAVENERMNRPPTWSQVLLEAQATQTLLNLDNITMAFVRPKGADQWTLAYAQSQLYVQYLIAEYGPTAVGKLLAAFQSTTDTAVALKAALAIDKPTFEAGYVKFVDKTLAGLRGRPKEADAKPMSVDELSAAVAKTPEDHDLTARLAEALFRRGKLGEAKKLADGILKADNAHPGACVVKAKLFQRAGDEEEATALLQKAYKARPTDVRLIVAIGKAHLEAKRYAEAAELFEAGRKLAPLEADWLDMLARAYKETKNDAKLLPILLEVVAQDPDDLASRIALARLAFTGKKYAEAEAAARDALMIDVTSAPARGLLFDALEAQAKDAELAKLKKRYADVPNKPGDGD